MLGDDQRLCVRRRPPGDERKTNAEDKQLQESIGKRELGAPRKYGEACDVKPDGKEGPPIRKEIAQRFYRLITARPR